MTRVRSHSCQMPNIRNAGPTAAADRAAGGRVIAASDGTVPELP
jgi:hypothetical protein